MQLQHAQDNVFPSQIFLIKYILSEQQAYEDWLYSRPAVLNLNSNWLKL